MGERFRTIVADPPWPMVSGGLRTDGRDGRRVRNAPSALPYRSMKIDEIAALAVGKWAAQDAHLYLWTVNAHIESAYRVAREWKFQPSTLLVWCKPPSPLGGAFGVATEFVLFARRGSLSARHKSLTNWFRWPKTQHSAKPDAFLDLVERVSPAPRLELFARRARFGWEYWGDESLQTVELAA